jgi:hypothetical protein
MFVSAIVSQIHQFLVGQIIYNNHVYFLWKFFVLPPTQNVAEISSFILKMKYADGRIDTTSPLRDQFI